MSSPSISVMNCGRAFSLASHLRQSYSVAQWLDGRELHALRLIGDRFPFRPLRRVDAPAQFGQFGFRNIDTEGTNGRVVTARLLWNVSHGLGLSAKPST
jgi:hypothetical protein